jgi:hypothetical protein
VCEFIAREMSADAGESLAEDLPGHTHEVCCRWLG